MPLARRSSSKQQRPNLRSARVKAALLLLASTAFVTPTFAADYSVSLIGTSYPGFRITGANTNDFMGFAVSGAGDVNGDGLADLIVGAKGADPSNRSYAGETYVIFGRTTQTDVNVDSLGTGGFIIQGGTGGDQSGRSVCGAGDVNGDGLADILIGADRSSPNGLTRSGTTFVVFGKATNSTVNLASLGTGGFRINGQAGSNYAGHSVSSAGDVNGDGKADILVGTMGAGAYVVFGKSNTDAVNLATLGTTAGFRITGLSSSTRFGRSVSGAADVNGDGLADIIIGAPELTLNVLADVGASYIVFGKADTNEVRLDTLGSGGFRVEGIALNDFSGRSVAAMGDVNGDSLADLVVGSYKADPLGKTDAGEAYVIFGKATNSSVLLNSLGSAGYRIQGGTAFDLTGLRVAGVGDVTADGLPDILVGATSGDSTTLLDVGKLHLVAGQNSTSAVNLANASASFTRFLGAATDDFVGYSCSAAGDVNGDGFADMIFGAYGFDSGTASRDGRAFVAFSGATQIVSPLTYRARAKTGDAPRVPVGIVGNGSNDDSPDSRCWVDFADGSGPGLAGSSRIAATIYGTTPTIVGVPGNRTKHAWLLETDRTGWTDARVTLHYTDAEISGMTEANLTVYTANALTGSPVWTPLSTTVDAARNRVSFATSSFAYYVISDLLVTPTATPTPTPTGATSTATATPSPTPSPTSGSSVTPTNPFHSPTPTHSPTPSMHPTPSETPTHSATPSHSPTHSLIPTPSLTETHSPTPSHSPSPSMHPTHTPSPSHSATPSHSPTRSMHPTPSETPTHSPSPTNQFGHTPFHSASPSRTPTPSHSPTRSMRPTPSESPTRSATPTHSPTRSMHPTPSESPTRSATPSHSPSPSFHPTPSPSLTRSATPSHSPTPTLSPTRSVSPTHTPHP